VGLVEQIEAGEIETQKTFTMLQQWLLPMKEQGVDTIVLGCTHYPLVKKSIQQIMGDEIVLIETGAAIANRLHELSAQQGHPNEGDLKIVIYTTGQINLKMIDTILHHWEYGGQIMVKKGVC
jgi:glutamate racemase